MRPYGIDSTTRTIYRGARRCGSDRKLASSVKSGDRAMKRCARRASRKLIAAVEMDLIEDRLEELAKQAQLDREEAQWAVYDWDDYRLNSVDEFDYDDYIGFDDYGY